MPAPTTLTREELYELVWSEPMRSLAKRFGISDVALGKRCRAADIPLPGLGYWAKVQNGKPTMRAVLPPRSLGQSGTVEIGGAPPYHRAPDEELAASNPTPPPSFEDSFADLLIRAEKVLGNVRLEKSLAKPHSAIAKLLSSDDKQRAKWTTSSIGSSLYPLKYDSAFERRRLRFANSIFLAFARVGGKVDISGNLGTDVRLRMKDYGISFSLAEPSHRDTDWQPKNLPATAKMRLIISWHEPPPYLVKSWEDTEGNPLEDRLNEIAIHLLAYCEVCYRESLRLHYEYAIERKEEAHDRIRKRREDAEKAERERVKKNAAERQRKFISEIEAWRLAKDIRSYIDAQLRLRKPISSASEVKRLEEWANWAREQADDIDPLNGPPPYDFEELVP